MIPFLTGQPLSATRYDGLRAEKDRAVSDGNAIPFVMNSNSPLGRRRHRLLMRVYAIEMRLAPSREKFLKFLALAKLHRNFSMPDLGRSIERRHAKPEHAWA